MATPYTYQYSGQFRNYISQFLRIFSGIQVKHGNTFVSPQLSYGAMDRIVANVLYKDSTFQTHKMPMISAYLTQIEVDGERRKSRNHVETVTRIEESTGNRIGVQRLMGVPYKLNFDVSIFTSSTEEMFQLLEQILLFFSPHLNFQKSDSVDDWSYLAKCELVSITNEENWPSATDEQVIVYTLSFIVDAWLNFPKTTTSSIIETIEVNMKDNTVLIDGLDIGSFVVDEFTGT